MTGAEPTARGELVNALEALGNIIKFGQHLGGLDCPDAREGHDEVSVEQVGDDGLDPAGLLAELMDESRQYPCRGADHLCWYGTRPYRLG